MMNLSINRDPNTKRKREEEIFDPIYSPFRKKRCIYYTNYQFQIFNEVNKHQIINRESKTKRKRKRYVDIFNSNKFPFRKIRCIMKGSGTLPSAFHSKITNKYYERKRKRKQETYIFHSINIPSRKKRCTNLYYQYKCCAHDNDLTICGIYECTGFTKSQYEQMQNNIPEWSYLI